MKRIGVAFYGLPRGYKVTQPVLQRILDDLSQHFEVLPHYHLYRVSELNNPRTGERAVLDAQAYDWFKAMPGQCVAPDSVDPNWMADILQEAGDVYHDGQRSLRNLLLQLHSLREVTRNLSAERPDGVLFLRPDLLYHQPPDVALVRRVLAQPRLCLVPEWHWWGGLCDRFAVCGAAVYRRYGQRADQLAQFLKDNPQQLHAEVFLRSAMWSLGVKVRPISNRASRVREADRIQEENYDVARTLGGGRKQQAYAWMLKALPDGFPLI